MKKRIYSWLLVLVMAISLVPVYAFAQEVTIYTDSSYQINDLYDTGTAAHYEEPSEGSSYTALVAPVTYSSYGSLDDAAEDLREAMVARQDTVTVQYKMTTSTNDTERRAQLKQSVHDISDLAMAHTGVPNEGDYIRRHYSGWNVNYSWTTSGSTANVTATYSLVYHTTAAQETAVTKAVKALLEDLNLSKASDYEKILTVYDYITDTVRYDYANLDIDSYKLKYTAYAALIDKTAVCQGYANLFYRLMLELGIDCRIISGIGNGGPHGWNIVELGGKYYNLDSTWDEGRTYHSWFLLSPDNFTDHYREDEFDTTSFHRSYPMSSKNYTPADTLLSISKQPANVSVTEGETAKVTVTAKGEGLTYQWYFKNAGSSKFSLTSSFTGNSYSVTMDESRNGRQVYCVITDKTGNKIKTNTVKLSMVQAGELTITQQPKTTYTKQDDTAKVTVSATGDGLKYQWYIKNSGSTTWSKSSVTTNTYTVKMASGSKNRQVYCLVTDKYGNSVKTNTATLRMAATITTQPVNAAAGTGETVKFTVKAAGDGLKYQWYLKNAGSTTWTKSSVTGSSYSVKVSSSTKGRQIYCVVTDKYGKTDKSDVVSIGTPVKITTQPKTSYTKQGATAKATVSATGDGLKYQWYIKNSGSSTWTKSSNTTNTYTVKMASGAKDRQVYCVVTNKYGISVKTNTVTLRMAATVTTQPKTTYTQQGETAKVTVKAVGDGLKYQWYVKNAGSSTWTKSSNTTATYSVKMSSTSKNRQVYCVVTDKYGKTVKTNTVYLRMAVTITSQPTGVNASMGAKATVTVKAVGDGLTYQWYIKNAGSSKWTKSSVTTNTYSVTMSDSTKGRKVYCVITDKYGNSVTTNTAGITSSGTPLKITVQPETAYVQNEYVAKVTVQAEGRGLNFRWYIKKPGDSTWTKTSATSDIYSVEMSDTIKDSQVYCVVSDQYGNTIQSDTVYLRMLASIVYQPIYTGARKGETAKVAIKIAGDGLKYQWYVNTGENGSFIQSSITSSTYSVKMTEDTRDRQVYCIVTDKYGSRITTRTFTLKLYQLDAEITIDVGHDYFDGEFGHYARFRVRASGGDGLYEYQYEVFVDENATEPALYDPFSYYETYTYFSTNTINGTIMQITIRDSAGNQVVYRIDSVNKKILSKKDL